MTEWPPRSVSSWLASFSVKNTRRTFPLSNSLTSSSAAFLSGLVHVGRDIDHLKRLKKVQVLANKVRGVLRSIGDRKADHLVVHALGNGRRIQLPFADRHRVVAVRVREVRSKGHDTLCVSFPGMFCWARGIMWQSPARRVPVEVNQPPICQPVNPVLVEGLLA